MVNTVPFSLLNIPLRPSTSSETPHPMPYVREDAHHFDLVDVLKTLHKRILNIYSHREKPRDGVRWQSHTMWATNSDIQNLAQRKNRPLPGKEQCLLEQQGHHARGKKKVSKKLV